MRALVVSDIHGNLPALSAAMSIPHDVLISLGDLVGYGPAPADCVALIRDAATLSVQGNHDHAFGTGADPLASARFRRLAAVTTPIADAQLSASDRRYLADLPKWGFLKVDGVQFVCVHATPRDPLYEYLGPDAESWKDRVQGIAADAILVGHTHLQFRLDLGDRVVVNPGSLGQPKDGDPRAAYALIDDGRVTLHRVAYDVEATVAQLAACAIPARAIAELSALLRTGRVPQETAPTEVGAAGAISEAPQFDGDPS